MSLDFVPLLQDEEPSTGRSCIGRGRRGNARVGEVNGVTPVQSGQAEAALQGICRGTAPGKG